MNLDLVTKKTLPLALEYLCARDTDLQSVLNIYGPPPLWYRRPGFPSLIRIILEQQVSLSSAKAAYLKLRKEVPRLTAANFLKISDRKLKLYGFSRQKAYYCRGLAGEIVRGELVLVRLEAVNDNAVIDRLMQIKGIGFWTSHIYLIMSLQRPDIWPHGDLALINAVRKLKSVSAEEVSSISDSWQPWRSVAARIMWHYYLSTKKKSGV